ncbi:lamin tail domain-containing protein [Patescibacteria group bacterium]|nr:lamin tail domain-containing protein [Patescibacteria group bacterium]
MVYKVIPTIASILTAAQTGNLGAISTETDFTWQKAIDYYSRGEWEKAFFALGHVIHLIEDASVPAHTRNDPHANGDSYENWTAQFTPGTPDVDLSMRLGQIGPIGLDNLSDYFKGIAAYSNKNFYSDRTIGIQSGYQLPVPSTYELCGEYTCAIQGGSDSEQNLFLKESTSNLNVVKTFGSNITLLIKKDGGDVVMHDYWSRLSTKAVQYAAGVMHLFLNEAQAATKAREAVSPQNSLVATIVNSVSDAASAVKNASVSLAGQIIDIMLQKRQLTSDVAGLILNDLPQASVGSSAQTLAEPTLAADSGKYEAAIADASRADSNIETFKDLSMTAPPMSEEEKMAKLKEITAQVAEISRQVAALEAASQDADNAQGRQDALNASSTMQTASTSTLPVQGTPTSTSVQATYHYGGGGGGTASQLKTYPKLLVVEVQLASASSSRDQFVKIHNPNSEAVALTDWYLQRKTASGTSFGTFAPKSVFEGKSIAANGYFTVAHVSSTVVGDTVTTYGLTSNNTIFLKDPNGDIKDKVGWGTASDCSGRCAPELADGEKIERKQSNGVFSDTDDDRNDFALIAAPGPAVTSTATSTATSTETATTTSTATSTATSTTTSTVSSTLVVGGSHILISEIMPGEIGPAGSADKEWVELYNPTTSTVSLAGWSLKKRAGLSATSTVQKLAATSSFSGSIGPRGFFLIASPEWDGTAPDARYSYSYHLAQTDNAVLLYGADGGLVDEADYADIPAGESWERKALTADGCVAAGGDGEFLGNGCEATSSDAFDRRATPRPQVLANLPEPREAPSIVMATATAATSSFAIDFKWSEAFDATGATGTVRYVLRDASSNVVIASTTVTTTLTLGITEVGRVYDVTLEAVDRDGLSSSLKNLVVEVPSIFTAIGLYRDPRTTSTVQYAFDAYYDHYPFVPGDAGSWEALVAYLNSPPPAEDHFTSDPSATSALVFIYPTCGEGGSVPSPHKALILPFGSYGCAGTGGGTGVTAFPGAAEDEHFIVQIQKGDASGFTAEDRITTAVYQYDSGGWRPGGFYRTVSDRKEYFFQGINPTSTPPYPPPDIIFGEFDNVHETLAVSWSAAADADTLDELLRYQSAAGSAADLAGSSWSVPDLSRQVSVPVSADGTYVGVRAVDDFGNLSEPVIKFWNDFPAGYVTLPHQEDNGTVVGLPYTNGAQKISLSAAANIDQVALWALCSNCGGTATAESVLEVVADSAGDLGAIVATSLPTTRWFSWGDEVRYIFSTPVHLAPGSYWLRPVRTGAMGLTFYGSSDDNYTGGYWKNDSGDAGNDAYFYLYPATSSAEEAD